MTMMMAGVTTVFSLLPVLAAGFGAYEAAPAAPATLVKSTLLAAEIDFYDTFPNDPPRQPQDGDTCSLFGAPFDANVLRFPPPNFLNINETLRIFFTYYFRIKEYDDNSTKMDLYFNAAGIQFGGWLGGASWGSLDMVGKGAQEFWDESELADEIDEWISAETLEERLVLGGNFNTRDTILLFKDAPAGCFETNSSRLGVFSKFCRAYATGDHIPYPMLEVTPWPAPWVEGGYLEAITEATFIELQQDLSEGGDGKWYFTNWDTNTVYATSIDPRNNPASIDSYGSYKQPLLTWNVEGDGTYGGLGNPPLIPINE